MSWWRQTYDYARLVFKIAQKTEQHEADIKEMRREIKELTTAVQQLIFERQRDRETAIKDRELDAKDRELLILRLENQLFRHDRSLPPPGSNREEDTP
ncbi:MAG: hypothetical protein M3Y13_12945 [Armatimonadota bacterium]|nr:hypothetical protein [Armatimonadota bacterium]